MQTYTYHNKETGQDIKAEPERWAWMVVYKATPQAKAKAERETRERNEKLMAEFKERSAKVKGDATAIKNLEEHFDNLRAYPVETYQEELKQFGDDGKFHKFAEIRQEDVEVFAMYKLEDTAKRIELLPMGNQIFHFYRNTILQVGTKNETRARAYVFGWKGEKGILYNYIMPDDSVISAPGDELIIN
jgi:hypothetical protein